MGSDRAYEPKDAENLQAKAGLLRDVVELSSKILNKGYEVAVNVENDLKINESAQDIEDLIQKRLKANEPKDFKERLILERDQLQERADKLHGFLAKDESYKINSDQRNLLVVQLSCMMSYLQCLILRINTL